ncbi:putative aldo-keto reductase [Aspergillus nomiae NRRL 13137]|uniref:D-xylose reductase [NAD(P)H] n=1 Tax=Aspergillus nomiae NRRL (strain ATCC 15546 / NRRL 13137 / CBS 260.88 / M93) TaxID=1509407 RepID=A0A0L1IRU2_ASPN3|nr:putative aldo-keto reductase [Aspergillus nomiae NRRL 13137]KNG82090.1 putative aldo-keto reductase [Aspergillus nomiae NRRL 13137]
MMTDGYSDSPQGSTIFELNNGMKIPALGFGAMKQGLVLPEEERDYVRSLIVQAITAGYRLIDTSKIYATEDLVGEAIKESGVSRSDITVVTKLSSDDHHDVRAAFERSRRTLDTYIDIYIMHWPQGYTKDVSRPLVPDESPTYIEVYKEMEKLVGPDCRAIGVGNLTQKTLDVLLKETEIRPVVNEIEIHPRNPNTRLVPYCLERGIRPIAWGPLAGGPTSHYSDTSSIYENPLLLSLSSRYELSVGAVILSWLVQRGIAVIPHSSSLTRLAENRRLAKLTDGEIQAINSLHEEIGRTWLIDFVPPVWMEVPGKGKTIMGWTVQELGWVDDRGECLV